MGGSEGKTVRTEDCVFKCENLDFKGKNWMMDLGNTTLSIFNMDMLSHFSLKFLSMVKAMAGLHQTYQYREYNGRNKRKRSLREF